MTEDEDMLDETVIFLAMTKDEDMLDEIVIFLANWRRFETSPPSFAAGIADHGLLSSPFVIATTHAL